MTENHLRIEFNGDTMNFSVANPGGVLVGFFLVWFWGKA